MKMWEFDKSYDIIFTYSYDSANISISAITIFYASLQLAEAAGQWEHVFRLYKCSIKYL